MKGDNVLIFPQSRCHASQVKQTSNKLNNRYGESYGLNESELFLARLLHNIAEQYQLDPYHASKSISPYIPGLHSLVETVLRYCNSRCCPTEKIDTLNHILAETLVNSFRHAKLSQ
jgi:hypothetical protein